MIKFTCTQCGRIYRISSKHAGKNIPCMNCGEFNRIPAYRKIIDIDNVTPASDLLLEDLPYDQTTVLPSEEDN